MRKPRDLQFKRFAARLTELNNYFPLLLGSSAAKKMDPEADHVSSGRNKKKEHPHCHPTPIRAALASAREAMQAI